MKKILLFIISLFIVFSLSACGEGVTPVAYTRFIPYGEQYVYYSSDVYGLEHGQIEVLKSKEESERQFASFDLNFRFTRCLGADNIDDYRYTLVDLSNKKVDFHVDINKNAEIYSAEKKIYLNGVALTPTDTWDGDVLLGLTFEDVSFIRTNTNGTLDSAKTNTIEYK